MTPNYPKILLTPKGLRWLQTGHPWVFASDLFKKETDRAGVVTVCESQGKFLARALYSPHSKIALRLLSYKEIAIDHAWFTQKILQSIQLRDSLSISSDARRLVYAEADGLPSLIVDDYAGYLVVQTLSAGLEEYKSWIFSILQKALAPKGIFEKNDVAVRDLEKLPRVNQVISGEVPQTVVVREANLEFSVDLWKGQKTGAFLDQRQNRILSGLHARGVAWDLFSYEGWFACHLAQRAKTVICVESSEEAAAKIRENAERNSFADKISVIVANAFDVLKEKEHAGEKADIINLDPPAFVKSAKEKEGAWRGYKEINLRAMKVLQRNGGTLITSSCSYFISADEFEFMLQDAAIDTKTNGQILERRGAASDHPSRLGFLESSYLKCFFCHIPKGE